MSQLPSISIEQPTSLIFVSKQVKSCSKQMGGEAAFSGWHGDRMENNGLQARKQNKWANIERQQCSLVCLLSQWEEEMQLKLCPAFI